MHAQEPRRLGVIAAGLLECLEDELPLGLFHGLMVLGYLYAGNRLLFEKHSQKSISIRMPQCEKRR